MNAPKQLTAMKEIAYIGLAIAQRVIPCGGTAHHSLGVTQND